MLKISHVCSRWDDLKLPAGCRCSVWVRYFSHPCSTSAADTCFVLVTGLLQARYRLPVMGSPLVYYGRCSKERDPVSLIRLEFGEDCSEGIVRNGLETWLEKNTINCKILAVTW